MPRVSADINTFLTAANKTAARTVLAVTATADLPFLDVTNSEFGAVGDGSTDDTAAFESCFAAGVSSGIKRVYLPPGTYVLEDCLVPAGFHLFGSSGLGTSWTAPPVPNGTTICTPLNSTCNVFLIQSLGGNEFSNLAIQFGTGTATTSAGDGIHVESVTSPDWPGANLILDNVDIRNFTRGLFSEAANRIAIHNSCLAMCKTGLWLQGHTSSLAMSNCEVGGTSYDGSDCEGFYVAGLKGGEMSGIEFGNSLIGGRIETSSVLTIDGFNAETFSGDYVFLNNGQLRLTGSCNTDSTDNAAIVRSTAVGARTTFINMETRGFDTYKESRKLLWETNQITAPSPVFENTQGIARRMSSDFSTLQRYWNELSPWPQNHVERQRISFTGHDATVINSGGANEVSSGLRFFSAATAGSSGVANISGGSLNPVLRRPGDTGFATFDWSQPLEIRFTINHFAQTGAISADDDGRIIFGAPYNQTTNATLASRGIGLEFNGTAVSVIAHNGTTLATPVSLGTLADQEIAAVLFRYDGAGVLRASLNGGTEVELTDGPTGESTANTTSIVCAAWNTAGGSLVIKHIGDLEIAYY